MLIAAHPIIFIDPLIPRLRQNCYETAPQASENKQVRSDRCKPPGARWDTIKATMLNGSIKVVAPNAGAVE